MGETELQILQQSQANGRWAFVVPTKSGTDPLLSPTQPFVSDQLLSVDTPSWFARPWTITLASYAYQGGALPLSTAQPTDNQTQASCRFKAKLSWGVEGASETDAIVDYPSRGAVFQVQAANLRLSLFTELGMPAGSAAPILAGFLSPFPRYTPIVHNPTLTTPLVNVGSAASTLFAIPARAVGYRYYMPLAPQAADGFGFSQMTETGLVVVQFDTSSSPGPAPPTPPEELASNRAAFFPLNPISQFVQAFNVAAVARQVGLQFLLDLG